MEKNVTQIHKEILKIFREYRRKKPDFKFTLRKSDINKRLSKGYWFHGNEDYIAISFWSGMDWIRKVPNISLIILLDSGDMYLEFSSKDSIEKRELLYKTYSKIFAIEQTEEYMFKYKLPLNFYNNKKDAILGFIENEKLKIDLQIELNKREFLTKQNTKNRITFIDDDDFKKTNARIRKYEQKTKNDNLPYAISSIRIDNFGLIKSILIDDIPANSQWIFLTGENSSGKTSFLKAISIALCNGTIPNGPRFRIPLSYKIRLELYKSGKQQRPVVITKTNSTSKLDILTLGFAAYGPIRLNIRDSIMPRVQPNHDFNSIFRKPYNSLFNTFSSLIDIGFLYARNNDFPEEVKIYAEKYNYITEAIIQICDSIVDIHFGKYMKFFEVDKYQKLVSDNGLRFEELSSGYRNLIAMVSDMMIHLYYQQPNILDPSELVGIVIIDEIDLHFHPKMQKQIIIKIGELFPRIQFIVSTHSPIPLLGAPKGSVFLNIEKNSKNGINVRRLSQLEKQIKNLLPNTILTSDFFDLEDIESIQNQDELEIRLEDSYSQFKRNLEIDARLKKFEESTEKFPANLFK